MKFYFYLILIWTVLATSVWAEGAFFSWGLDIGNSPRSETDYYKTVDGCYYKTIDRFYYKVKVE